MLHSTIWKCYSQPLATSELVIVCPSMHPCIHLMLAIQQKLLDQFTPCLFSVQNRIEQIMHICSIFFISSVKSAQTDTNRPWLIVPHNIAICMPLGYKFNVLCSLIHTFILAMVKVYSIIDFCCFCRVDLQILQFLKYRFIGVLKLLCQPTKTYLWEFSHPPE